MIRALTIVLAVVAVSATAQAKSPVLMLASQTFAANGSMPREAAYAAQGCGGQNVSPELHWSAPPSRTKSFALTMRDPDAPVSGGWWHWVMYNLPGSMRELPKGQSGGTSGTTSFGTTGYGGPCPPPGPAHHYVFTLYALDNLGFEGGAPPKGPELQQLIRGHVLAKATLVGLYSR
jgi:Raf kinase inhibitor-like YbhB/YbcL family protein